ncbi:protein AMN1 homolog [Lingula anatina]|uniref:Protein AMN1 homolog n=1 Tax=Lingula anatina TaxID=7574 RepID=A0A1S3K294_LINAN|nr:protein AMN1 homolog [Lingula anatina]|eukprot:XP_013416758.1 protein AMN1 homolog [Lingula anatina]
MAAAAANYFTSGCNTVPTLLNISVLSMVGHLSDYLEALDGLPPNLKDKLLHLMSKRGLITDGNIQKVVHSGVRMLDLSESDVTDQGLQYVRKCKDLKKIDLNSAKQSRTNISSEGIISVVTSCRQLQIIYLRRCLNVSDDAVIAISQQCPQLRQLNIGGCHLITDKSLQALGENSRFLKSVNFSKTRVTDEGVISLATGVCSATLKEIHMDGCVQLTDEAVEAVTNFCPAIDILLFHGCPHITDRARQAIEDLSQHDAHLKQVTWTIY